MLRSTEETSSSGGHDHKYTLLDGLRGVAASAVVLVHANDTIKLAPHAGEAVDFFYVLSGFVIAHAYGRRLADGNLKPTRFLLVRAVRLYPMIIFGTILGAMVILSRLALWRHHGGYFGPAIALICGMLLVPLPPGITDIPFSVSIFPYSLPAWSLFSEAVSNIVYSTFNRWLTDAVKWLIVVASGVVLGVLIMKKGGGSFGGYWSELFPGLLRVSYSFTVGVIIFQFSSQLKYRIIGNGYGIAAMMILLLACCFPVPYKSALNPFVDVFLALLFMPALVILSSRIVLGARMSQLCDLLGRISYPLYLVHWPIVMTISLGIDKLGLHGPARVAAIVFQLCCAGAAGFLALVLYDEPVRRWLGARLLRRQPRQSVGDVLIRT